MNVVSFVSFTGGGHVKVPGTFLRHLYPCFPRYHYHAQKEQEAAAITRVADSCRNSLITEVRKCEVRVREAAGLELEDLWVRSR